MGIAPLPAIMIEDIVRASLAEDLGRAGDITTAALGDKAQGHWSAAFVAREKGILAGLDLARLAFHLIDPSVHFLPLLADGASLMPGQKIAEVEGRAASLLMAERVALNFLSHLSGIASQVHLFVEAAQPHKARIACTRKTLPGLRTVQKYAVRAGGGINHRFGLDDAVMLKDNHIALMGGVRPAVEAVRARLGHLVKIEVEVDTLDQLSELLALEAGAGADAVLLDNMSLEELREAVRQGGGRLIIEASGGVTLETVNAIAATGVDLISSGALTHSVRALDIGLDSL